MALRKHDSMVVTEIISAFSLIGVFTIAVSLFLIHQDLSLQNILYRNTKISQEQESVKEKITVDDLAPELTQSIFQGFIQGETALAQSNQEIAFFINKILAKNFTEEEVKKMGEEFQKIRSQQIEAAKAQQKNPQKQPVNTISE